MVASALAILSALIVFYRSAHTPLFYFEIAMSSSQPGNAQVFYDIGRGFNESDSARSPQPAAEVMSLLRVPLPEGEYRAIRFDPIEHGGCSLAFRDARIVNISGQVVRSFSLPDFQAPNDIMEMQIRDNAITLDLSNANTDPHLTISLDPSVSLHMAKAILYSRAARDFTLLFLLLCAVALHWLLFIPRRWSIDALLFIFLIGFVVFLARARFLAPISWDEELFLWQGWMVKGGSVPYRDFFEPKPPLIFFLNALGLAIFGLKDNLYRIVPTAIAASSILLFQLAMIRQRVLPWLATLLSAQAALWLLGADFHDTGLNDTETYGFAFTLAGFSLGSLSREIPIRSLRIGLQVTSGIFLGLAISSKELFVASAFPAWLLVARPIESEKWNWQQLLFSALGVAMVGITILAYMVKQAALTPYLELVRYYRPMAENYCVSLGRFPKVTGFAVISQSWNILHRKLYDVGHLAFILPLWAAFFISIQRRARPATKIIVLTAVGAAILSGMLAISVGSCFWKHYFLLGAIGLLLPATIGARALSNFLVETAGRHALVACAGLSILFVFVASGPVRTVLGERPSAQVLDPLAVQTIEAHSKPGDYVLSTESPYIYVATNRKSPFGVCGLTDEVLPYTAAIPMLRIETLRENLEKHVPKVCYFSSWMRPRQQALHELLYDPFLAEHHYIEVTPRIWYLPD